MPEDLMLYIVSLYFFQLVEKEESLRKELQLVDVP